MAKKTIIEDLKPGFYKLLNDELLYAEEYVLEMVNDQVHKLIASNKDQYTYPSNGWNWFDSADEAIDTLL